MLDPTGFLRDVASHGGTEIFTFFLLQYSLVEHLYLDLCFRE